MGEFGPSSISQLNLIELFIFGLSALDLKFLPRNVEKLTMIRNALRGTIDLTQLPQWMRTVCLNTNEFSADSMDGRFPETMRTLALDWNKFTGSIDLRNLPAVIQNRHRSNNESMSVQYSSKRSRGNSAALIYLSTS
ncbi:leucine-rich repeat protein [Perkinsela sp. CCAP 1560/4]|nr:leucine-rich repeat protein [Perkinsela sp. CCAP 1560/4]|eukprot:KNH06266.1 leucine-rich repeat protein [Perkinsela sp. CCAP 1560/4]